MGVILKLLDEGQCSTTYTVTFTHDCFSPYSIIAQYVLTIVILIVMDGH